MKVKKTSNMIIDAYAFMIIFQIKLMDITCGVLVSHGSSDTKLYTQLSSLLYNKLCILKNSQIVSDIQRVYYNGIPRIRKINDKIHAKKREIETYMKIIEKYNSITIFDIDIIKVILNARNTDIPDTTILFGLIKIFDTLYNDNDAVFNVTMSNSSKGQSDGDDSLPLFDEMIETPNEKVSLNFDEAEELFSTLTYGYSNIYTYYEIIYKHKDNYNFNIHVENPSNTIRAVINAFSLLSENRITEFTEYSMACNHIGKIIEEIRGDNNKKHIIDKYMKLPVYGNTDTYFIYAPRTESDIFMEALLRSDYGKPVKVTATKTIDELNKLRTDIIDLDNKNDRYGIIDKLLTTLTGCTEINNDNNEISRLDMIFMIDEYPAGSKLENYAIFDAISRFQQKATELLKKTPTLSIYHADGNYKASIMRNVCFSKCETEYMVIRDDDDIGCSLIELRDMIETKIKKYPDAAIFSIPVAVNAVERIAQAYGMWCYIYRPKILRLFSINNPPYLMSGEDYITMQYIEDQILNEAPKLGYKPGRYFNIVADTVDPEEADDAPLIYIYMDASNRANDLSKQNTEWTIYNLTMNTILGLPIESTSIRFNRFENIEKERFIEELQEYSPLLFDRVYSFKKLTLLDKDNGEPFYAFATNRPYKEDLEAAKERFNDPWFDRMIPRKCRLNESTGEVIISDDNPMKELEKYRDKNTFNTSEWDEALKDCLKTHAPYIEKLTKSTSLIDGSVRVKLFGGKQTTSIFKWILLIVLVMIVLLFVCYAICRVCKRITLPWHHLNHHVSSGP
jgi:hypothetical protein